jgi:hypothetical protein
LYQNASFSVLILRQSRKDMVSCGFAAMKKCRNNFSLMQLNAFMHHSFVAAVPQLALPHKIASLRLCRIAKTEK